MLNPDTHCEMLTQHIRDRNNAIIEGFKSFLATFTAIVGGSVAIIASSHRVSGTIVALSDILVILLGLASGIINCDNYRAWWHLRLRLSEVSGWDPETGVGVRPQSWILGQG